MIVPFVGYIFILLLSLVVALNSGCPHSCICKWRNGKQTVECLDGSLLIIPEGIDMTTQVLDASGNKIGYLVADHFIKAGLIHLQKLYLNRCRIKTVDNLAFSGLTNLVELDLSENMLEIVPTEALVHCPALMKLSLSKNPISSVTRLAFNHLSSMTTLDLSGCQITGLDGTAFMSLYSLEWIDLSGNKIRSLPDMQLFPGGLKGVQLHENPWLCDCQIRTFNIWLTRNIVPVLIQPTCLKPEKLRGIPINKLRQEDLACAPEVTPSRFYLEAEQGRNLTLLCQVESYPPVNITWMFKGHVLRNGMTPIPNLNLQYFIFNQPTQGTMASSNLFIQNLHPTNNGTFSCLVENVAGAARANYTIMIIQKKETPIRIEEEDPLEFSIDLISIVVALGLLTISLCFVALIMALVQGHSKSERREREMKNSTSPLPEPRKSILKHANSRRTSFPNSIHEGNNPDIINGICQYKAGLNDQASYRHSEYVDRDARINPAKLLQQKRPILVVPAPINGHHRINVQPYLNPTLTVKSRPVSAPTFERFVERSGIPMIYENTYLGRQISKSEQTSPGSQRRYKTIEYSYQFDDVSL